LARPTFHLVTPVWGAQYTKTFVDVTLPSLLAPGNIPALSEGGCTYKIFTTTGDEARIRQSPAFQSLPTNVAVEFRPITKADDNPYVASSSCYRTATAEAQTAGVIIVYLIPDMILADGSLRTIKRFLEQGKRAVMVAGMRVSKETLVPEALARFKRGTAISAPSRPLVELAIRHLHPIMRQHMYDEDSAGFNPSFFCWKVPDEGYVVHCAHLHPVAVDLQGERATLYGTIDDDLLFDLRLRPEELAYADDSDDLLWFEISARDRTIPPVGHRLWEILRWLNGATYPHQRQYLSRPLRIHCCGTDSAAWRATEARAGKVIATILEAFELEKDRIGKSPADYTLPPPVQIGGTQFASDPTSAIHGIMNAVGAAAVVDAVIEALEARARSYLQRGASRRFGRSLVKFAAAILIIGAGKSFRALLRLIKRL